MGNRIRTRLIAVCLVATAMAVSSGYHPGAIEAAESSPDLSVRQRAAWALGKIGPVASAARGTLKRAAGQGDERLARLAKEALESIGG